jgi:predicted dehydrogenase
MARARIAVIGAGVIGRRHAALMARSARGALACIADPSDAAAPLAAALGVPHHRSIDAMLAAGAPDGAILATPNALHLDGGLALIAAGIPALIEKPLAVEVADARRLVEAAAAAGVALMTGHHRRHNPLIAEAKAMIARGDIGVPVSVHGQFWLAKPDAYFEEPWRRAPGAGPVFMNLTHDIDLLRHLVGEIAEVQAMTANRVRANPVEDAAVILLRFENGALGAMNVSDAIPAPWSWEMTAAENPAYPATGAACCHIGGTLGALELPSLRLWHDEGRRDWMTPIVARMAPRAHEDPLVRQIDHFAAVIAGEAAPLCSGREGLRTLEVLDAIRRAAQTGRPVAPHAGA